MSVCMREKRDLTWYRVDIPAVNRMIANWKMNIIMMKRLSRRSRTENFEEVFLRLRNILVSTPVYTTRPYTYLVFRSSQPCVDKVG